MKGKERARYKKGARTIQGGGYPQDALSLQVIFRKKNPIIRGFFAKNNLPLKTSYASSPPCIRESEREKVRERKRKREGVREKIVRRWSMEWKSND